MPTLFSPEDMQLGCMPEMKVVERSYTCNVVDGNTRVSDRPTCLVFDIETDTLFKKGTYGSERNEEMRRMEATVVCALEIDADAIARGDDPEEILDTARSVVCWRDDNEMAGGPFEPLFAAMDRAMVTVCYNGSGFDMPVLRKYYGSSRTARERYLSHVLKLHDPFSRVRDTTGQWTKLDVLLRLNGVACKIASGIDAVRMWETGEREDLVRYCVQDVRSLAHLVLLHGGTKGLRAPVSDMLSQKGAAIMLPTQLTSLRSALAAACVGVDISMKESPHSPPAVETGR